MTDFESNKSYDALAKLEKTADKLLKDGKERAANRRLSFEREKARITEKCKKIEAYEKSEYAVELAVKFTRLVDYLGTIYSDKSQDDLFNLAFMFLGIDKQSTDK
ncbi:MAG: hypothetical protein HC836_34380 [Richelia sp. RM2_1_2]|nr:hypothetical protein [Richelia sp. SM1_7_0]NJO30425.1 hypothetical protein [Richelia sp. SL_2_1]NJO63124.1 hypothetical protein [Richelia sp. RM2_1_2]